MTPTQPPAEATATAALAELADVLSSTGKHADHQLRQVGRCAYCSCGARVQGRIAAGTSSRTKRWQVRLADGFIAYVGTEQEAHEVAARHPGAQVQPATAVQP